MPISEIAGVLSSFNALKNIIQAAIDLHDAQAFKAKVGEIYGVLLDAQSKMFSVNEERTTLIDRVRTLEEQITDFENWETERQRYELQSITSGSFAYVMKAAVQGNEPPHKICAKCYQDRKKSILQLDPSSGPARSLGKPDTYSCPRCGSKIIAA
jgi:DNA-directed RNA polymerase subunit RPC12/RpoP